MENIFAIVEFKVHSHILSKLCGHSKNCNWSSRWDGISVASNGYFLSDNRTIIIILLKFNDNSNFNQTIKCNCSIVLWQI